MQQAIADSAGNNRAFSGHGQELRLLALDGGGVRGLSSLQILKQLMITIDAQNPPKPCDVFDLIGGTSTGGLIAIMLGRLQMNVDECIQAYCDLSDKVFQKQRHRIGLSWAAPWNWETQGRFDSKALEQAIKDIVASRGLDPDSLLKNHNNSGCRVFVCATSAEIRETVALTSYESKRWPTDLLETATIWQAGRATAAATTFFDPIEIGISGETFIDGATGANNPIWELWNEAADIWPEGGLQRNLGCLISIGTGMPTLKPFGEGLAEIGKSILDIATETEKTAKRFIRHHTQLDEEHRYYRFNVLRGLENVGLEDSKQRATIVAATRSYITSEEVHKKLRECGQVLEEREWYNLVTSKAKFESNEGKNELQKYLNNHPDFQKGHVSTLARLTKNPEYSMWLTGAASNILWYHGPPGCGKTYLATDICSPCLEELSQPKKIFAFFFCRYRRGESPDMYDVENQLSYVLRRIIGQILQRSHAQIYLVAESLASLRPPRSIFRMFVPTKHVNKDIRRGEILAGLWELLWHVLLSIPNIDVLLVIDALDELGLDARVELIRGIKALQDARTKMKFKIFLTSRPYADMYASLEGIPAIDQDSEMTHCLNSLHFKEWHSRRSNVTDSLPGTNEWIWTHPSYLQWLEDKSDILWIQGKPGSGKSTLAKMIQKSLYMAKHSNSKETSLNRISVIADFFYSARMGETATSHEKMLQSILYQILSQDKALYYYHYQESFQAIQSAHGSAAQWAYPALIKVLSSIAETPSVTENKICCILDALDESEGSGTGSKREELLSWLSLIGAKSTPRCSLKIVVVSRPANDIERKLKGFLPIIVEDHNQRDIVKIISAGMFNIYQCIEESSAADGEISSDESDARIPEFDPSEVIAIRDLTARTINSGSKGLKGVLEPDLEFVRDYLMIKANGVILWVVLVLDELLTHVKKGFFTRIDIQRKLYNMPIGLGKLYQDVISRLCNSLTIDEISKARFMLTWCCLSKRALTVAEFREAIAMLDALGSSFVPSSEYLTEHRTEIHRNNWIAVRREMMELCGSLIEVNYHKDEAKGKPLTSNCSYNVRHVKARDTVQIIHQTVKEFLVSNDLAMPFRIHVDEGNQNIALGCMRYLMVSLLNETLLDKTLPTWDEDDFFRFVDHLNDRPLLVYVFQYLTDHNPILRESTIFSSYFQHHLHRYGYVWTFIERWYMSTRADRFYSDNFVTISDSKSIGKGCLKAATKRGHIGVIQLLFVLEMAHPIDVDKALLNAVKDSNDVVATLLINKSSKGDPESIYAALNLAAEKGNWTLVSAIFATGHISVGKEYGGKTLLHLAAISGNLDIVEILLEAGVDPNALIIDQTSAFGLAIRYGREAVAKRLLDGGARKPCLRTAAREGNLALARLLAKLGMDSCPKGCNRWLSSPNSQHLHETPLHVAALMGNIQMARIFVDAGLNINEPGPLSRSPIFLAEHEDMVRYICVSGANVNYTDPYGRTVLHESAEQGLVAISQILIAYRIDVNAQDLFGRTALHEATNSSNTQIVNLLLNAGADITLTNYWGETAMSIAVYHEKPDVIQRLQEGISVG